MSSATPAATSATGEPGARLRYPVMRRSIPQLQRHSHPMVNTYSDVMKVSDGHGLRFPQRQVTKKQTPQVFTIPTLADSYSYILVDLKTREAALIDPTETGLVMEVVKREKLKVQLSVATSHMAHVGSEGHKAIVKAIPKVAVVSFDERVPGLNRKPLEHNQILKGTCCCL
jgi:hypothetical protein